ncbi:MAG: ImmA/IrrE family metallo-endopeptidase [Ktedonobacteraceae bacterium]
MMNNAVTSFLIENTAQEFWTLAGEVSNLPLPRNIKAAIVLAVPLELYPVPVLRVNHVVDWMRRVQLTHAIRGRNRRLHGCLLADHGQGAIFFDADDSEAEQRFTLAHELAHFLLDYLHPRERALTALGASILPVLDGERAPTVEERLHAVLSAVPLGVMSHVMERPDTGLPATFVIAIEDRADRLALELLAPTQVLATLMQSATAPKGFELRLVFLTRLLVQSYGLPEEIAATCARYILTQMGEPTFRDWLSGYGA